MRSRSVVRGRRSATAIGAMVTDMDTSRSRDRATTPERYPCPSPAMERGTGQQRLLGAVDRLDELGHGRLRGLDLTMEELGDDVVIGSGNSRRLGVVLRQRSEELAVGVGGLDVGDALLAA